MIDVITTENTGQARVRSRVNRATAVFYPDSNRIVIVADRGDLDAAQSVLTELRTHLGHVSATSLVPAGALQLDKLAEAVAACHACPGPGTTQNELLDVADAVLRAAGFDPHAVRMGFAATSEAP